MITLAAAPPAAHARLSLPSPRPFTIAIRKMGAIDNHAHHGRSGPRSRYPCRRPISARANSPRMMMAGTSSQSADAPTFHRISS